MKKEVLKHLAEVVRAVMRGDYSRGKDIIHLTENAAEHEEEKDFLESLDLMTVKLEAREFALQETIKDLKTRNAELLQEKQRTQLFSSIFISLFLSISLFVFLMAVAEDFKYTSKYSARIVEIIFLTVCIFIIRKGRMPVSSLGITLKGLARSIRIILPSTFTVCVGLVAIKGLFMLLDVQGMDGQLIIVDNFDLLFLAYLPVAVLQEFLARGVIQTSIESVLEERNGTLWAIITSAALFGLVHIELSVGLALASFIFSIYWGYLYSKEKCLVGVSLSHFLIGDMAYLLGFWDYLCPM